MAESLPSTSHSLAVPLNPGTYSWRVIGSYDESDDVSAHRTFTVLCNADFNEDLTVSVPDIFSFLNAWFDQFGTCTLACSAGFNEDAAVSVSDIFSFLNVWFTQFNTCAP